MGGKKLWGALLATSFMLMPALAFGQEEGLGKPGGEAGENYAPPDSVLPIPLFSTHPEAGGLFLSGGFWFERQSNPITNQQVAVYGFVATSNDVIGVATGQTGAPGVPLSNGSIGQFIGSASQALNVQQVSGPGSYQPGYVIEGGWKFENGSALSFTFRQLTGTLYSATATSYPLNYQLGNAYQNTFLTAFVYNFPNAFVGPQSKVDSLSEVLAPATIFVPTSASTTSSVSPVSASSTSSVSSTPTTAPTTPSGTGSTIPTTGSIQNGNSVSYGAAGIWNGASEMSISFVQRFTDYFVTYRFPVIDTENYRLNGVVGPRASWIWEAFTWRTVDIDEFGNSGPQDVGVYSDVISNYMYGIFVGCQQEWYWGYGLAGMLDTRVTGYVDIVKERARYQLGDKEFLYSVANKRAIKDFTLVPEAEATASLMWYPYEGIQVQVGYNVMAFLNTIAAPQPIDFNYSALDPTYKHVFREFDGFQASIAFSF